MTYIDESGTSGAAPHLVVAGVIVNGDEQLVPIEEHIESLIRKFIPEEHRQGFTFHASQIWNANGIFANSTVWPDPRREEILAALVDIPRRFDVPIALGFVERGGPLGLPGMHINPQQRNIAEHGLAFVNMTVVVERFLRDLPRQEVAIFVHEDRAEVRQTVKEVHAWLRSSQSAVQLAHRSSDLPLTRVRDTTHFAEKKHSKHLQLADVCAYFIRGFLAKNPRHVPFYDALRPLMLAFPKNELETLRAINAIGAKPNS